MHAFAKSLEIDITDAKQFFLILSGNGRRTVDIETFVVGCIKLKGTAKSMDLMDLMYSHKRAATKQAEFNLFCKVRLNRIERILLGLPPDDPCGITFQSSEELEHS